MLTLAEFLAEPNPDGSRKRKRVFAAAIKSHPTMVTEYALGRAWPGRERFEAMVRESGGRVTPNDFLSDEARKLIARAHSNGREAAR